MRPVLFEWHGVRIYSYPAMLYLGMTCAIIVGNYTANLAGMNSGRVFVAMILLTIPGLLGARLLFVAAHWPLYRREPRRIWRRSEGGAAMQGGLVLAVLASPLLLGALGLPLAAFWDVATFGMLIWLVLARLGCLFHGCCSGRPSGSPFAIHLPDHRGIWQRRIPTQALEASWAALLLLGAAGLWSHRPFAGALFLLTLAAYGIGRFTIEPMHHSRGRRRPATLQQALSAALVVLSLIALVVLWHGASRQV